MAIDPLPQQVKSLGEIYATEERKVLLQRWFNEDSLINQRLTWLLLAQGLLFAAYGTLATKFLDSGGEKAKFALELIESIKLFGILFSSTILIGIVAAIAAQMILYFQHKQPGEEIGVHTFTTIAGWLTGVAVPVIFIFAWAGIPRPDLKALASECKSTASVPSRLNTAFPEPARAASTASSSASAH